MASILIPHSDSPWVGVGGIRVEATRPSPGRLALRYGLTGAPDAIRIPPPAAPLRTDDLWRHTCFEAFLRVPDGAPYLELNLAPSGQWAAYAFDGYREGMRPADLAIPPTIAWRGMGEGFELTAELDLTGSGLPPDRPWQVGLSAVVEETSGRISHWALAHPPGRADFHHQDGFALTLPGPAHA